MVVVVVVVPCVVVVVTVVVAPVVDELTEELVPSFVGVSKHAKSEPVSIATSTTNDNNLSINLFDM